MMRNWYWTFLLVCGALNGAASKDTCWQQIQIMDAQIQKLEVQKKKHIDLAKKYQAEGDQWQYRTGRIDDAHQAWLKADHERAQAIECQRQIDLLLEQKASIYQYYPELRSGG